MMICYTPRRLGLHFMIVLPLSMSTVTSFSSMYLPTAYL